MKSAAIFWALWLLLLLFSVAASVDWVNCYYPDSTRHKDEKILERRFGEVNPGSVVARIQENFSTFS